ncbi:sugar transferase [Candidatus Microgenomates bacterium]|nr:sugar transferase [Candidatus Microgenomates bacterium]
MNILFGSGYDRTLKRILDLILAFVLFIAFLPIFAATAIAIKLTSPGPIFADVPERVGQNGRRFKIYKFRSMIDNAHQLLHTDPQFAELYKEYKQSSYKLVHDPRITPVGKFIRKHSFDEIPQFLNVLTGDMSVVGPRAYYIDELNEQQKKYPHTKQFVNKVLSVKPGITGLWQVSGRSEINFDKRIALDAYYVDTISLWNDLKIIFKTPWIMVTGKGAV